MRRHSPARSLRSPPPKRRGRLRSLSPLSRNQPLPPGEERSRKAGAPWDGPRDAPRNKRFRSRSRSRGWMDRPYMEESDRVRARDLPRDKDFKDRPRERSRDRNRERDRPLHIPKDLDVKHKHPMKPLDSFEESYLDHTGHFRNGGMPPKSHDIVLEPSGINYNIFVPDSRPEHHKPQDKPMNRPRDHPPPRETRRAPPPPSLRDVSPKRGSNKRDVPPRAEKVESASERINRLEKMVEKLVEKNTHAPSRTQEPKYPKNSKELIPELIPSNKKFTTSMWLNTIHEECLHRNYDEKSSIRYTQDKMTGIMKAWFKSVSNYDFTWPELKLLITKTFPDNIDFANTLKLLVSRDKMPEETITQYFFSKVYLCEACKITGENAVSCLIDGLSNPFMKQEVKSFNFLTPEVLYSEYLSKFPENEVPVHMDRREVREVIPDYSQGEYVPLEMDLRGPKHMLPPHHPVENFKGHHLPPQGMLIDRGPPMPIERQKCFTCKKFGHTTFACRHAPICYSCKKKGHIASKCQFNKVLLILSETKKATLPEVECKINGQRYNAIIDTGSVAVTIRQQVSNYLQLKMSPTNEVLKSFGGSTVQTLGETEVLLQAGAVRRVIKALIIEDDLQDVAVIIGQEFLSQDGVTMYQKNGEVTLFEDSVLSY